MAIVYTQTWAAGSHAPAFHAAGDFYGVATWLGSGSDVADSVYPDVISSENVIVNAGAGPSGENVVGVHSSGTSLTAGIVVHPPTWPALGDDSLTSANGCLTFRQHFSSPGGSDYFPIFTISNGLFNPFMVYMAYDDGDSLLHLNIDGVDVWTGAISTGWHDWRISWKRNTGASDGFFRLYRDGPLLYDSSLGTFGDGLPTFRTIWFGYFGFAGPLGTIRLHDTPCQTTTVGPPVIVTPRDECCDSGPPSTPTGGHESGRNTGGYGWTPTYTGASGAVPSYADPAAGETLTDKDNIELWAEVEHAGTTYRWAVAELADATSWYGGLKEGRLTSVTPVENALSDYNGNFEGFRLGLSISDADRAIRSLLDTAATKRFLLDEIRLYLVSHAGRLANVTPRLIARAQVDEYPSTSPLTIELVGIDPLFGDFGKFKPDRKFPENTIPRGVFTNTPEDIFKEPLPIIYGEVSDNGALDLLGQPAEKGLCPLTYVGQETLTDVSAPQIEEDTTQSAVTSAGRLGWAFGTFTTEPSFVYVAPFRNGLIGPASVLLGGLPEHYDPNPHGYRIVWNASPTGGPYIIFMFENAAWSPFVNPSIDPAVRYKIHDGQTPSGIPDWDFAEYFHSSQDGNRWFGNIPEGPLAWDVYVLAGHAIYDIISIYGSDLGISALTATDTSGTTEYDRTGQSSTPETRIRLDPDSRSDILVPGFSNWPHAARYRDYTSTADGKTYRMTVVYARGPLSESAKAGRISLAANVIGIEDVGDGTGLPIVDYFPAYQHFLENFVLAENGYTSGDWTTSGPSWEDGTSKVMSSSFSAAQTLTIARIGGYGYRLGWCMAEQFALRDVIQYLNDSGDCRLGQTGHGRLKVTLIDYSLVTTAWPRFEHSIDLFGGISVWTAGEQLENEVQMQADYDADARCYRVRKVTATDPAAVIAYKNHVRTSKLIGLRAQRYPAAIVDISQRRLAVLKYGPRYAEFTTHIGGMDLEIGDGLLLTTIEGDGTLGYVDRPLLILRRQFDGNAFSVRLTCLDMQGLLADPFTLGSEAGATAPILGSEVAGTALTLI